MRKPRRSQKRIAYHGRSGHPVVHEGERGGEYIMVRAEGGGTKRQYIDREEENFGLPRTKHNRR